MARIKRELVGADKTKFTALKKSLEILQNRRMQQGLVDVLCFKSYKTTS